MVAEEFHEVFDLVKWDRLHIETGEENDKVAYYFRAENKNYAPEGSSCLLSVPAAPSLFRDDKYIQNEHVIFNEAIRCYPQEFSASETTFERLTRMAHFGLPTRLLDVSPRLATAIGMASLPSPSDDKEKFFTWNGFIRVYRVNKEKIKYSTSDTIVALSNLARIKPENIDVANLGYLAYECKNERAGFYWEEGSDVSEKLMSDIKKVWCVRPVNNNVRIQAQRGEFFIFGCGDKKEKISASFTETDYYNKDVATNGIAEIGIITLTPSLKREVKEMAEILDVTEDRLYPDFGRFHNVIKERFGEK
jgi:hypothetical protein